MELVPVTKPALTRGDFERLADVPPEEEWLANITNGKTRRAYKTDVREFIAYAGLHDYGALRSIARAHVIDWRRDMDRRALEPATIRRKLSALSMTAAFAKLTWIDPAATSRRAGSVIRPKPNSRSLPLF